MSVASPHRVREEVSIVSTLAALEALRDDWPSPPVPRWGPMATHDWTFCAARHLCSEASLHVIVLRRAGGVVAVAPLCRVRRAGVPWLEIIGDRALFEPTQLIAADDEALGALATAILQQRLPVFLQRLEADDPSTHALQAAARGKGRLQVLPRPSTHFVPEGASWGRVGGGMIDYRRKRRRLEARGKVTTSIVIPSAGELPRLLDAFVEVEATGWKARNGTALASQATLRAFFVALASRLAERGTLRMCMLECGNEPVAAQICVEQDRRFWVLKMGYDEQWSRCSPGMLLTADTIQYALESSRSGFEFLGVAEPWQRQWTPQERPHCAVVFYPPGIFGAAAWAIDVAACASRPLRRALRK